MAMIRHALAWELVPEFNNVTGSEVARIGSSLFGATEAVQAVL